MTIGQEATLTIEEAAKRLRWSYSTTLRYFENVDGTIIKPGIKSLGRTKRKISIPESIYLRELQKMSTRQSIVDTADDRMHALREQKRLKSAAA
jgi:hypothetical protein